MLPEAADLAQNRPLWRMTSMYGATQSWVACQKRWRLPFLTGNTCLTDCIQLSWIV